MGYPRPHADLVPPGSLKKSFNALPIQSFAGFDTVYQITSILRQYQNGYFRDAAILADAMSNDDRIDAVMQTRIDALLGAPIDVKGVDDRYKAKKYATMLGGTEDGPGEWDKMFPAGTVGEQMRSGLELNFGVCEILWTVIDGLLWPRLRFWHSQFVRWDESSKTYKLMTADQGEITLPDLDANPNGDGKWFIWCPFGYKYAWRRGLVRSLAPMYMRRMWLNRDWPRFNEVYGNPVRKAIVPMGAGKTEEHDAFFNDVANFAGEATVLVQQGPDGQKYDIELVEASGTMFETFRESKADVNTDIAVLVLGQNLTTEATGGGLGDGGASTHNLVRIDKAKKDANWDSACRDQVLYWWAKYNFGDGELAPRPMHRVEPAETETEQGAKLKAIGDGLAALRAGGVDYVDERAICEEAGITLLSEEEAAARKAERALEAEQNAALNPPTPTDGTPPKPGQSAPPKKAGLSANHDPVITSILALAALETRGAVALSASSAVAYPDKLTAKSIDLAARALAPDVADIKDAIERCGSFAELEKQLPALYANMDSEKLARIVQRVRLMSRLAGMAAIAKGK